MEIRKILSILMMVLISLTACSAPIGADDSGSPTDALQENSGDSAYPVIPPPGGDIAAAYPVDKAYQDDKLEKGKIYVISSVESEVRYVLSEEFFKGAVDRLGKALGVFETIGRTQDISGEIEIDLNEAAVVKEGIVQVNVDTLVSDDDRRDQKVQEDYLLSTQFPVATYEITGVEGLFGDYVSATEITFTLLGNLTIRGETQEVVFKVTGSVTEESLSGIAVGTILMSDFGITPPEIKNFLTVNDEVELVIEFAAFSK